MWPFRSALLIVSVQPFKAFITSLRAAEVSVDCVAGVGVAEDIGVLEDVVSGVGVETGVEVTTDVVLVLIFFEPGELLFVTAAFEVLLARAVSVPALVPLPLLSLSISHAPRPPRPSRRIVAITVMVTTDEVLRGFVAGAAMFWNSLKVGRAC